MELSEMQDLWADHEKQLSKSLKLNETLLKRINLDKAVDYFKELLAVSVHGRNMAFIYFLTSVALAFYMRTELVYSITIFLGGLCMLGSFIYHLNNTRKFTRLDMHETPILDLQKAINEFKVSSISTGKYDFSIVVIWLATLIPAFLKLGFEQDIYTEPLHTGLYVLFIVLLVLVFYPLNVRMYLRMYGEKLSNAEGLLNEISDFKQ
ncbi:MAG: hypothetical protein V4687_18635 [Bacteroidota bacterium]